MKKSIYSFVFIGALAASLILFVSTGGAGETADPEYSSPAGLSSLVETRKEPYILIDVRTREEYDLGYIPTAENIPYDIIGENLPSGNKDDLIIVYCRSGRRSAIAADTLKGLGYLNVVDFGGVNNWPGELVY